MTEQLVLTPTKPKRPADAPAAPLEAPIEAFRGFLRQVSDVTAKQVSGASEAIGGAGEAIGGAAPGMMQTVQSAAGGVAGSVQTVG